MTVPIRPPVALVRLPMRTAHTAAGSAATLLRLAESATLASAAWVRAAGGLPGPSSAARLTGPAPELPSAPDEGAEEVGAEVAADDPTPQQSHGQTAATVEEPPAPDAPVVPHWDELNLARIRGRLSRLSLDDLRSLLAYERTHAGRFPVLTMLENRIRKTAGDATLEGAAPHDDDDERPSRSED